MCFVHAQHITQQKFLLLTRNDNLNNDNDNVTRCILHANMNDCRNRFYPLHYLPFREAVPVPNAARFHSRSHQIFE